MGPFGFGAALHKDSQDEEFALNGPETAGHVINPAGEKNIDLTLPVHWLMDGCGLMAIVIHLQWCTARGWIPMICYVQAFSGPASLCAAWAGGSASWNHPPGINWSPLWPVPFVGNFWVVWRWRKIPEHPAAGWCKATVC